MSDESELDPESANGLGLHDVLTAKPRNRPRDFCARARAEAWPVVAAGLGSALIVSWITLIVVKKQRGADSDRLDQQLVHDRESITKRYDDLAHALDEQLGLQPTRETRVMYRQLLRQT